MIVKRNKKGFAVYAARFYHKGETICVMTGKKRKGWASSMNPLQVGKNVYLDLDTPFTYINHSCDPSAGVRGKTALFALHDIEKGEEITFDYSTTIDETFKCKCGSQKCRGYVPVDFWGLPVDRKHFYFRKKALSKYIRSKFRKYLK